MNDFLLFHRIIRYNKIQKYKNTITLYDLEQIDLLDNKGFNYKEIADKLKINLNKIKYTLEMKQINNVKIKK